MTGRFGVYRRSKSIAAALGLDEWNETYPECRVPGCRKPLLDEKAFYKRHKICLEHAGAQCLNLNGMIVRFCQLCGTFHELWEFDGTNKSCREKLKRHNEQRRLRKLRQKQQQQSNGATTSLPKSNGEHPRSSSQTFNSLEQASKDSIIINSVHGSVAIANESINLDRLGSTAGIDSIALPTPSALHFQAMEPQGHAASSLEMFDKEVENELNYLVFRHGNFSGIDAAAINEGLGAQLAVPAAAAAAGAPAQLSLLLPDEGQNINCAPCAKAPEALSDVQPGDLRLFQLKEAMELGCYVLYGCHPSRLPKDIANGLRDMLAAPPHTPGENLLEIIQS